ncbi:MAG: tetratricopeptide repeat protein [Deltaproteobacteria bacterium]|nr:tetratricopeptide repeat protein [Deltaproteobacteria bacterium]
MKRMFFFIAIGFCAITFLGCATAQNGAMSRAHSGISKGEYEFALKRLSEAESYRTPTPDLKAEIIFLRATCYEGLGKYDDSMGALNYLIENYPDSRYVPQARVKINRMESNRSRESIQIAEIAERYVLTVPLSKVVLKFPKKSFILDTPRLGGGTNSPRYFQFIDTKTGIIVSGWFEPARRYQGSQKNWEIREKAIIEHGLPASENISLMKEKEWEIILYTSKATGLPHMLADCILGDTWIELHVSLNSASSASADTLIGFLRQTEFEIKY